MKSALFHKVVILAIRGHLVFVCERPKSHHFRTTRS